MRIAMPLLAISIAGRTVRCTSLQPQLPRPQPLQRTQALAFCPPPDTGLDRLMATKAGRELRRSNKGTLTTIHLLLRSWS